MSRDSVSVGTRLTHVCVCDSVGSQSSQGGAGVRRTAGAGCGTISRLTVSVRQTCSRRERAVQPQRRSELSLPLSPPRGVGSTWLLSLSFSLSHSQSVTHTHTHSSSSTTTTSVVARQHGSVTGVWTDRDGRGMVCAALQTVRPQPQGRDGRHMGHTTIIHSVC